MRIQQPSHPRIVHQFTYILPAFVLSDATLVDEDGSTLPSLREEASRDDLCYVRVVRRLDCGTLYQAIVAASPKLLRPLHDELPDDVYPVFFTEGQLRYALPLDSRTEEKCSSRLCSMLRAHATSTQPTQPKSPEQLVQAQLVTTTTDDEALLAASEAIDVNSDDLQGILEFGKQQDTTSYRVQQALLCLVIDALMQKLYGCQSQAKAVMIEGRCKLMLRLRRWQRATRQRVVNVISFVSEQQQAMWRLVVGVPSPLAAVQAIPQFPYGRVSSY